MKPLENRIRKIEDQANASSEISMAIFVSFVSKKDDPPPDNWRLSLNDSPLVTRMPGESCKALKERAKASARKIKGEVPVLVLYSA